MKTQFLQKVTAAFLVINLVGCMANPSIRRLNITDDDTELPPPEFNGGNPPASFSPPEDTTGSNDPGATDPGSSDPGTSDPGSATPTDPGSTGPSASNPPTDPGSTTPPTDPGSTTPPGTTPTDPGSTGPSASNPPTDPGSTTPPTDPGSTTPPGTTPPSTTTPPPTCSMDTNPSQTGGNSDFARCAAEFPGQDIVIVDGDDCQINAPANSVIMMRTSGSDTNIHIQIASGQNVSMCLFMTANQSNALIEVSGILNHLYFIGRGNLSHGDINVHLGGQVNSVHADLSGNQASLNIFGDGTFSCDNIVLEDHGNNPTLTCN